MKPETPVVHPNLYPFTFTFAFLYFREALSGFNTLNFPNLSYNPFLGFSAFHEARKHNICLCNQHIDLQIISI